MIVVIPVALLWGAFNLGEPGYLPYTRGFVIWSQNNAPFTMLDSHHEALVHAASVANDQSRVVDVPRNRWPLAIQQLSPSYVWVYPDESIDFVWGGGFGHWGLSLHEHESPRERPCQDRYVVKIEPSLDAWHELQ